MKKNIYIGSICYLKRKRRYYDMFFLVYRSMYMYMQVELMYFNFSSYAQMKAASGLLQGTYVENDKGFLKLQVFNSFTSCNKM